MAAASSAVIHYRCYGQCDDTGGGIAVASSALLLLYVSDADDKNKKNGRICDVM